MHGQPVYDLAEQFMLECTSGSSCNGGWPEDAMEVAKPNGIPLESAYPYKGNDNYFGSQVCNSGGRIKIPATITLNHYYKNSGHTQQ